MLVIGIDPGTARTGFGLVRQVKGGYLEMVDFGVITTSPDMDLSERLQVLHNSLVELLTLHRPESGAVEKLFFKRNVSTALAVGQARGVAMLALAQAGVPVCEYTPGEVKQAVAGYGAADKRQVQEMVRLLLKMEQCPQPDDAADALAVAICHMHVWQTQRRLEANG